MVMLLLCAKNHNYINLLPQCAMDHVQGVQEDTRRHTIEEEEEEEEEKGSRRRRKERERQTDRQKKG
jgi:hypothetical protein